MSKQFDLPRKDFFSKEDLCKRWEVSSSDIDHYVSYQESLRLCALNAWDGAFGGSLALDLSMLPTYALESLWCLVAEWQGKTLNEISNIFASAEDVPLLSTLPLVQAPIFLYQPRGVLRHSSIHLNTVNGFKEYLTIFENFHGKPFLLIDDGEIRVDGKWTKAIKASCCEFRGLISREELDRFESHIPIGDAAEEIGALDCADTLGLADPRVYEGKFGPVASNAGALTKLMERLGNEFILSKGFLPSVETLWGITADHIDSNICALDVNSREKKILGEGQTKKPGMKSVSWGEYCKRYRRILNNE